MAHYDFFIHIFSYYDKKLKHLTLWFFLGDLTWNRPTAESLLRLKSGYRVKYVPETSTNFFKMQVFIFCFAFPWNTHIKLSKTRIFLLKNAKYKENQILVDQDLIWKVFVNALFRWQKQTFNLDHQKAIVKTVLIVTIIFYYSKRITVVF